MPKRRERAPHLTPIGQIMDSGEASLLDVLDHVLAKGVMASGDLTLGVAGVDLIYVRLSGLLCAADRVLPQSRPPASMPSAPRRRRPAASARSPRKRRS